MMGTGIDDDFAGILKGIFYFKNFQSIIICISYLGLPNLTSLNVSFCYELEAFDMREGSELDEAYAANFLAVLSGLSSIRYLNMDGNLVTNRGLQLLNGLTALQGLSLIGCRKVDSEGIARLQEGTGFLGTRHLVVYNLFFSSVSYTTDTMVRGCGCREDWTLWLRASNVREDKLGLVYEGEIRNTNTNKIHKKAR